MKALTALSFCLLACSAPAFELDDFFDRLDRALTVTALDNNLRARLSGTLDLEVYHFEQPAPGLIDSRIDNLFNPRLTLFLDAQYGSHIYFFAQSRLDRGFDPSDHGAQVRLDEYALRITPWGDGRFNFQIGKFATVVGNWVPRHLSWENPFVNAPLVYENITAVSDKSAPASALDFVRRFEASGKYEFNPVIWGPSYASGISVSGRLGQFDYAAEMKNSPLMSRPESWSVTEVGFDNPTFNARVGFRPDQAWNFGLSAGEGAYFRREAEQTLPRGHDLDDYREFVLGQDVSFALHHLQLWAEFYEARFEVPRVGDADTFAYYLEAKYKFTPQWFAALRWNQQFFNKIDDGIGGRIRWSQNLAKIDIAAGYRFTSHTQLKLQYSLQHETTGPEDANHIFAAQFTVRF
ncbi:MAG TPA: hypothetical protein VJ281_03605 [Chthoniobacterales bacterium]|jgi:hypothetical protein|nr:hypothetical protein [Chthoniobacterales bacterium]